MIEGSLPTAPAPPARFSQTVVVRCTQLLALPRRHVLLEYTPEMKRLRQHEQ